MAWLVKVDGDVEVFGSKPVRDSEAGVWLDEDGEAASSYLDPELANEIVGRPLVKDVPVEVVEKGK